MSNLLELIKKAAVEANEAAGPVNITYGEVITTSPLSILIEQKMTLPAGFFILTRAVTDHYVDMTVSHVTENRAGGGGYAQYESHNHDYSGRKKFMVHNGLQVGEQVLLLRIQGGQKYIVLDRAFEPICQGEWS